MNELGVEAAISLALAMHPVMPLEGSVRTKVAPNALAGVGRSGQEWTDGGKLVSPLFHFCES